MNNAMAERHDIGFFTRRLTVVLLLAALGFAVWLTIDILLATFFGAFLAILLHRSAAWLQRRFCRSYGLALALLLFFLLLFFAGVAWLIGPPLVSQIAGLSKVLPQALANLKNSLQQLPLGRALLHMLPAKSPGVAPGVFFSGVSSFLMISVDMLTGFLLVIVVAIYGAAEPQIYRNGILHLTPPDYRERVRQILNLLSYQLWRWACGQMIAMGTVGGLFTLGLWALGVPSALALGVIAALLEFIPFVGPIIFIAIAMLMASTVGLQLVLYVLVWGTAVQQFESQILIPWIQRHTIRVPPAISVVAIAVLAVLLGPIGILLSGPLTAAMVVLMQAIYVESVLGDEAHLP